MESNLRPLTLGEILDRTAQLYRANFLLFAGIFSIYAGVSLALGLTQLGFAGIIKGSHWAAWAVIAIAVVRLIAIFLLLGAAIAAISRTVASLQLGEPVTIRSAYAATLPKLGRYLWLMTLAGLRAWGPLAVLYGGLIGAAVVLSPAKTHGAAGTAPPATTQDPFLFAVVGGGILLFFLPAMVYTIWMTIRYSLGVPASVVEDVKARQAIKRSIQLSKGARGRIFALLLLVLVIKIGLVGLTQSFLVVLAIKNHGHVSSGLNALSQAIQFFTDTVLGPIGATGLTLFYFDQRVRKEAYDIEWMMQAAGLVPDQAPHPDPTLEPGLAQSRTAPILPEGVTATEAPGSVHE
jgi:hypothetical protein